MAHNWTGSRARFMKVNKKSVGYAQGIRYIDFGKSIYSKVRFLKRKPKELM